MQEDIQKERMKTLADWLRYYNDLDVAPGLEALEKMRAFYTEKGIDILKDAVSLPGVSLHYLLRGTIERGAEMYSPCKEAYDMLKTRWWAARACVQAPPRGRCDTHQTPQIYKNENMPTNYWLRRQHTLPINDDERNAMWKRKSWALQKPQRCSSCSCKVPESRYVVWFCRGRHRNSAKAVDEV